MLFCQQWCSNSKTCLFNSLFTSTRPGKQYMKRNHIYFKAVRIFFSHAVCGVYGTHLAYFYTHWCLSSTSAPMSHGCKKWSSVAWITLANIYSFTDTLGARDIKYIKIMLHEYMFRALVVNVNKAAQYGRYCISTWVYLLHLLFNAWHIMTQIPQYKCHCFPLLSYFSVAVYLSGFTIICYRFNISLTKSCFFLNYNVILSCPQIMWYIMAQWSYSFVCTLNCIIIIIMQTYLKVMNFKKNIVICILSTVCLKLIILSQLFSCNIWCCAYWVCSYLLW